MSHEERGIRFANVLHQAHVKTGQLAVVLIDEYDKPLLDVLDTGLKIKSGENDVLIEDYNRNVLKAFYSVFKLADADLRFVMLTGVTKFSQVGFSQANDISSRSIILATAVGSPSASCSPWRAPARR
jgi:hypothetical protein